MRRGYQKTGYELRSKKYVVRKVVGRQLIISLVSTPTTYYFLLTTYYLFSVRQKPHKPRAFNGSFHHLLVLKAQARVITLAHIPKVIEVRLKRWIIFVIDVANANTIEGAKLLFDPLRLCLIERCRHESVVEKEN